jgi:predicted ATP-grasp superfamily ATP-dependent carboligase
MRIGAFEIQEPLPELNEPHVLACLRPWVDVNNVGTMTLDGLEARFGARELGRLAEPGLFYDFTRYRPMLYNEGGQRRLRIPNSRVAYAQREGGNDFIFLRLMEPHALGERFVDSVLKLLTTFQAKRYILLGSMYDAVPHTRPLIVNGRASGTDSEQDLKKAGVLVSHYEGPTTITSLIPQQGVEMGIESLTLIVSLPQYVNVEEDYLGKVRLLEVLNTIYGIPIDQDEFEKAGRQRSLLNQKIEANPELKKALGHLENIYNLRMSRKEGDPIPGLSSEMEQIFWDSDGKDSGKA